MRLLNLTFFERITAPHHTVTGQERQRARSLIILIVALIPIDLLAALGAIVADVVRDRQEGESIDVESAYLATTLVFVCLLATYAVSRTLYYRWANWGIILAPLVAVTASSYFERNAATVIDVFPLYFMVLSILFAALLATPRATLFVMTLVVGSTLFLTEISMGWLYIDVAFLILLCLIMTPILMLMTSVRNSYEARLDANIMDLERAEQRLKATNRQLEQRVAERTEALRQARDLALAAQQRAEDSSRLKTSFLSLMSHELRTPLNTILGNLNLLQMESDTFSQENQEIVQDIDSSAYDLLRMINTLLDFAQIEAGRIQLHPDENELRSLVEHWGDTARLMTKPKGLDCEVSLDPKLPLIAVLDEQRTTQIVLNLISNAAKFTPQGKVSLSVLRVDADHWRIIVRDTGIGISREQQVTIFNAFEQNADLLTREHGGIGLGLSIVKLLVDAMHGSIELESTPQQGSTFTVTLPLKVALEPQTESIEKT